MTRIAPQKHLAIHDKNKYKFSKKKILNFFFGHIEGIWMKKGVGGTTENVN